MKFVFFFIPGDNEHLFFFVCLYSCLEYKVIPLDLQCSRTKV